MKKHIRAIAAVAAATSIYVFPDADESYISHIDASSIVDGYVGSGEAPLCLSGIKSSQ